MIPLILTENDVQWSQDKDNVVLKVPIKGIKSGKTVITTSQDYVRVYFAPFIFEAFLWDEVDDEQGTCRIDETADMIIFELDKLEKGQEWPALQKTLDRDQKKMTRSAAITTTQKRHEERKHNLASKRQEQKRMVVNHQIRIDGQERERITAIKNTEAQKALTELDEWRQRTAVEEIQMTCNNVPELEDILMPVQSLTIQQAPKSKNIFEEPVERDEYLGKKPVRDSGRVTVSFTARHFPTPSRESTALQEQEWLKKQAEARKKSGFNDEDLRPEERDPDWLLEKGRSLMDVGSHLGAVSAFSLGIKMAPKMPQLYLARAEAQLALQNTVRAVEDASQALELYTPKVAANAHDRFKCHSVRGDACRSLNCHKEAAMDYEEALKISPKDKHVLESLAISESRLYEKNRSSDPDD